MTTDLGRSVDQTDIKFLVEKNADGIIVVDEAGVAVFANPAAGEMFGRPTDALIGTRIGVPLVAGETTEISIRRPGGDQIDAEVRCVDTTWNHRAARLASLRDISARKVIEEQQRHSVKMEAIGRLTAGIAHDNAQRARILIVDDEPLVRMFVVDALSDSAVTTEEADSFADAMTKFQAAGDDIAAAVVDLGLPDRSGAELVTEIRTSRPDLPIVVATGFSDRDVHQRLLLDPRMQMLEKPFDRAALLAALHDLEVPIRSEN